MACAVAGYRPTPGTKVHRLGPGFLYHDGSNKPGSHLHMTIAPLDRLIATGVGPEGPIGVQPLSHLLDQPFIVLLGAPGMGKSVALDQLAQLEGETCHPAFAVVDQSFAQGSTIYLDALDEISIDDAKKIARVLQRTPGAKWRISCRAESWNDGGRLSQAFGEKGASREATPAVVQLLPLTESEAVQVLHAFGCIDPAALLAKLEVIRSTAFAMTPLGLKFLTAADVDPRAEVTRFELYQSGVQHLANEHNMARVEDSPRATLATETKLDIAGRVSLALLVSGRHRINLSRSADASALTCDDLSLDRSALTAVLDTALFIKTGDVFQPLHRSIQEFLAGRYLARLVTDGVGNSKLPAERALALIVSSDGLPADAMRPLYAWYAGHLVNLGYPDEAMKLAQLDPDALLLHGDTAKLPDEARLTVLRLVGTRDPFFRWAPHQWRPAEITTVGLITAGILPQALAMLSVETSLYRVNMMLEALSVGEPHPAAADACWDKVVSEASREWCRRQAVAAWLHCARPSIEEIWTRIECLMDLAVAEPGHLRSGAQIFRAVPPEQLAVADVDRILGMLKLAAFTPQKESRPDKSRTGPTNYTLRDVAWHTVPSLWPGLITENPMRWRPRAGKGSLEQVFASSLGYAVVSQLETTLREFTCLLVATGVIVGDESSFTRAAQECIAALGSADDLIAEIVEITDQEIAGCGSIAMGLLSLGIVPTAKMLSLLLNSSQLLAKTGAGYVARQVLTWALRHDEATPDWLPPLLTADLDQDMVSIIREGIAEHEAKYSADQDRLARDVGSQVLSMIAAYRAEEALSDEQIYSLTYCASEIYSGNSPFALTEPCGIEALNEAFGAPLAQLVIDELLHAKPGSRNVVSAASASLRLDQGSRLTGLATPEILGVFLSAMCMKSGYHRERLEQHCVELLEQAFRIEQAPFLELSSAEDSTWTALLYKLGENPRAGELQAWAVKTLFQQPELLEGGLLGAAHRLARINLDDDELASITRTFIDRQDERSYEDMQVGCHTNHISDRLQWAYFGVCIQPDLFSEDFTRALEAADDHTIHSLIVDDYPRKGFSDDVSTTITISTLLMRFFIVRSPMMDGHYDRVSVDTAKVMKSIRLSNDPWAETVILSLLAEAEGTAWELLLRHDLEVYRRDARELSYFPITPGELVKVIQSKGPINVQDLRALTLMVLREIAGEIQSSPLNLWSRYWNVGRPMVENDCRDVLADKLRDRLRFYGNFEVYPEAASSGGTRADMLVTCGTLNLPLEAKRTSHDHLWYGHSGQLQTYVLAPSTEGQGIYVVFWFGAALKVEPSPEGVKPESPKALEVALEAQLPAELRVKTSVVVLDLSDASAAAKVRKESEFEQAQSQKREKRERAKMVK